MIQPDWSSVWTAKGAETQLPDFVFKGPGIYHTANGDSMLVIPVNRPREQTWNQRWVDGEVFHFHVYSLRNVADILNLLVGVPTRE